MHVIVIGAGVAGIAAAQGLRRIGARVTLLERAPRPQERGYQLGVAPNGRYALDRLGLLDALDAEGRGWPLDTGLILDAASGRVIQHQPQPPDCGRYRMSTHYRCDVHRALLAGLEGEGPHYGVGVEAVVDPEHGPVRVVRSDGSELTADLVVGADGARSRLRAALFGPRYEYLPRLVAVIAAAQVDASGESPAERLFREQMRRHEFVQLGLPGRLCVLSLAAEGRLGLILAGRLEDGPRGDSGPELQAYARRMARGMRDPRVHHGIDIACWDTRDPERAPGRWEIGDIEPLPGFARGRVALVGDAAHAMLPVLGQGANQGFEDALRLADALKPVVSDVARGGAALGTALQRWSRERRARAVPVQRLSRRIADLQLGRSRLRYRIGSALLRHVPRAVSNRQENALLRYAIADPECPIEPLDERWLRIRPARSSRAPAPAR